MGTINTMIMGTVSSIYSLILTSEKPGHMKQHNRTKVLETPFYPFNKIGRLLSGKRTWQWIIFPLNTIFIDAIPITTSIY